MSQSLIVRGAPQEYECKVGAWDGLESHLNRRFLNKVLILHGKASWAVAQKFFPELPQTEKVFAYYGGNCTDELTEQFAEQVKQEKIEAIIAVGGGKIADLGKATANQAQVPIIILPTLAATCAAYTPLSVIYNDQGEMVRYDVFTVPNALTLIEPLAILDSPKELMVAGIGDTLAKWYEADAIISQLAVKPVEVTVAHFAATKCRENLLENSQAALDAMTNQVLNQEFLDVIETNILLAGMVGGFGDDYGRCAGAHSIHDALTIIPASHHQLHGNKVAYGIFVQLVIENKWSEIDSLVPFYNQLGLPKSLADMGMADLTEAERTLISERATEDHETIHYMKETITPEIVKQAMFDLEKHFTN